MSSLLRPHAPAVSRRRSFTLIELIVVIVVLGVLAGIAIVGYSRVIDRSEWASLETTAESIDRQYQALLASDPNQDPEELALLVIADMPTAAAQPALAAINLAADPLPTAVYVDPGDAVSGLPSIEVDRYGKTVCLTLPAETGESVDGRVNRGDCAIAPSGATTTTATTTPVPGTPPWPGLTAVAGNASIELLATPPPGTAYFDAHCFTSLQDDFGAWGRYGWAEPATDPLFIYSLENYVEHTCEVYAYDIGDNEIGVSDLATATPEGNSITVSPGDPFQIATDIPAAYSTVTADPDRACDLNDPDTACSATTVSPTADPWTGGLWDVTSLHAEAAGPRVMYSPDRGQNRIVEFLEDAPGPDAAHLRFYDPDDNFIDLDNPTGVTLGASPARTRSASEVNFSVLYSVGENGDVWMLDPKAARGYPIVFPGSFNYAQGLTWSACYDSTTGAMTTVSATNAVGDAVSTDQCLYVSTDDGLFRVPLITVTASDASLHPSPVEPADLEQISTNPATKVFASADNFWISEDDLIMLREFDGSTDGVETFATSWVGGVVEIPAAVTGTTDLVVYTDPDAHTINKFDPADPAGTLTLVAGSEFSPDYVEGVGIFAQFDTPQGLHFHGNWPYVYVADTGNGVIRKVNVQTGETTTVRPDSLAAPVPTAQRKLPIVQTDPTWVAQVDWTHPEPADVDLYRVELRDEADTTTLSSVDTTDFTADFSGLDLGLRYRFRVTAIDASSNESVPGVAGPVAAGTVPGTPTNVVITPSNPTVATSTVTVTWDPPVNTGNIPITYTVRRGTTSITAVDVCTVDPAVDPLECSVPGWTNGTSIRFWIRASNDLGPSVGEADLSYTPVWNPGIRTRGYNWDWQVGNNSNVNASSFTQPDLTGVLDGRIIVKSSVGGSYQCAVDTLGDAFCWGLRTTSPFIYGQLGNGTNSASGVPVAVNKTGVLAGLTITDISAGTNHACAIADGEAYCWGRNNLGQLGNGLTVDSNVPVKVMSIGALAGKTVTQISAQSSTTCAIADGEAFCWGGGTGGQLGNGVSLSVSQPVAVDGGGVLTGRTVTDIDVGGAKVCAVADGAAYCWGDGGVVTPRLGDGTTNSSNIPVAVSTTGALAGKTVTEIEAGSTSCAIANGRVHCWGSNGNSLLGQLNTTSDALSPVLSYAPTGVSADFTVENLDMSGTAGCYINASTISHPTQAMWCWGWGVTASTTNQGRAKIIGGLPALNVPTGVHPGSGTAGDVTISVTSFIPPLPTITGP